MSVIVRLHLHLLAALGRMETELTGIYSVK